MWIVYIVDYEAGQTVLKDKTWVRQLPPQDSLFWKFIGRSNLVFTKGEEWKKHSRIVTSVFLRSPPTQDFVIVMQRLLNAMNRDAKKTVAWEALAKRVTMDILGISILGSDVQSIDFPDVPIPSTYNRCIAGLTAPSYIFLPFLDKHFPRSDLVKDVGYKLRDFFSSYFAMWELRHP